MEIDLSQFLAAVVEHYGDGELRIPYDTFVAQTSDKALAITIEDDGKMLLLEVINTKDIPNDAT